MHAGKDRAAAFFSALSGWKVDAFGNYLKQNCSNFSNVPLEYFHDSDLKNRKMLYINGENITLRQYMQKIGSCIRSVDEDAFVRQCMTANQKYKNLIISDVRLLNEAKAISQVGGVIVRIERSEELRFKDTIVPPLEVLHHESEVALDEYDFDFIVQNNSTAGALADEIIKVWNAIKDIENL